VKIRTIVAGGLFVVLSGVAAGGCGGGAMRRPDAPEGVSFLVSPSDAEVLVDNVARGKASDYPDDRPLRIQAGAHQLELRAPDHVPYVRRLDVSHQAKRIEATLLRREGAAPPGDRSPNGAPSPAR
jgi:hypothetical protein